MTNNPISVRVIITNVGCKIVSTWSLAGRSRIYFITQTHRWKIIVRVLLNTRIGFRRNGNDIAVVITPLLSTGDRIVIITLNAVELPERSVITPSAEVYVIVFRNGRFRADRGV